MKILPLRCHVDQRVIQFVQRFLREGPEEAEADAGEAGQGGKEAGDKKELDEVMQVRGETRRGCPYPPPPRARAHSSSALAA